MSKRALITAYVLLPALLLYAPAVPAEAGKEAGEFLQVLEKAINGMHTYDCLMISENRKGKRCEKKTSRLRFKKPNLMRLDVLKGRKRGSSVILDADGRIRGKNSWGLRQTLKPTDKRLKNIRGYTFLNASLLDKVDRLKKHILDTGCAATVTEEGFEGKNTYRLHIGHNDKDNPVTSEDVWFDKKSLFLLKNIKYEGELTVSDITWREIKVDIPLEDSLFKL